MKIWNRLLYRCWAGLDTPNPVPCKKWKLAKTSVRENWQHNVHINTHINISTYKHIWQELLVFKKLKESVENWGKFVKNMNMTNFLPNIFFSNLILFVRVNRRIKNLKRSINDTVKS